MEAEFKPGDSAYLIESNRLIREVTIVKGNGGLFVVRFRDGGGIQVKQHRLFHTMVEAEEHLPSKKHTQKKGYRSPYDYPH